MKPLIIKVLDENWNEYELIRRTPIEKQSKEEAIFWVKFILLRNELWV